MRVDTFLESSLNDLLVRYCQKKEIPRARVIEKAVKEYLERHKEEFEDLVGQANNTP